MARKLTGESQINYINTKSKFTGTYGRSSDLNITVKQLSVKKFQVFRVNSGSFRLSFTRVSQCNTALL